MKCQGWGGFQCMSNKEPRMGHSRCRVCERQLDYATGQYAVAEIKEARSVQLGWDDLPAPQKIAWAMKAAW